MVTLLRHSVATAVTAAIVFVISGSGCTCH